MVYFQGSLAKVDFFELLLAKAGHAIKGAGWSEKVQPLKVSASDILGGKNTMESNRLLQLLCYLGLRTHQCCQAYTKKNI